MSDFCFVLVFMQSVEGEHHEKAVELLKAAQGSVKLVVRYTPKVLEEMEARFEKIRSARRRQQHTSYSLVCSQHVCMWCAPIHIIICLDTHCCYPECGN